ncbi:sulfite exporter TauE/SafE family protein [Salicibibacter cibi]|uniref:Probable membrane transporter protein n=1 Tax=Salicibibacter cibi TaxID=2743001 RepID=A0A7T6ZBL9_9BACI|nr:sulfite exporter TauE/SafE family protein [Salicibibacter cibi]QQK80513.1 sulfite exporter TauE/SafE family protein [Salicibibacter cibi]
MFILLIVLGILASAYGIIVGAGGGFILVPMLLLFYNISPQMAAGTGLAIVFLNSVSGLYPYLKQQRVQLYEGTFLGLAAIPGTLLGNWLVNIVNEQTFYYAFSILLVGLGLFLSIKKPPETSIDAEEFHQETAAVIEHKRRKIWLTLMVGIVIGVVSSFFGIGGGWLLVPILVYLFHLNMHKATATSIYALSIYSFVGLVAPIIRQDIDWEILLWSGIGVLIGSQVGALISKRLAASTITRMLAVIVILIGITLLV